MRIIRKYIVALFIIFFLLNFAVLILWKGIYNFALSKKGIYSDEVKKEIGIKKDEEMDFYNEFWIENSSYIQNDKFVKYNLFKRVDLWENSVQEQLQNYKNLLVNGNQMLDSVISVRDSEIEFIWWVLNSKD